MPKDYEYSTKILFMVKFDQLIHKVPKIPKLLQNTFYHKMYHSVIPINGNWVNY